MNQCREFGFAGNMDNREFNEVFLILKNMELIIESKGAVRTHSMGELEDENQKRMFTGG